MINNNIDTVFRNDTKYKNAPFVCLFVCLFKEPMIIIDKVDIYNQLHCHVLGHISLFSC